MLVSNMQFEKLSCIYENFSKTLHLNKIFKINNYIAIDSINVTIICNDCSRDPSQFLIPWVYFVVSHEK